VISIHTIGNRIVVADIQDSFHFVRYKRQENQLIVFTDDTNPRWITASCMLDYNTVAGADKFGNITVVSFKKKNTTNECKS
jgi:splicing factor 3B subunit 3